MDVFKTTIKELSDEERARLFIAAQIVPKTFVEKFSENNRNKPLKTAFDGKKIRDGEPSEHDLEQLFSN